MTKTNNVKRLLEAKRCTAFFYKTSSADSFKNTLLLLYPNSRWVHNNNRDLRQRNNQSESTTTKACTATKLHHKATGQHYLSQNYFRKTSGFLLYVSYHLVKGSEGTKWWNHLNKKLRPLEYLFHDRIAGSWTRKILTNFSVFTQDTYRPGICLARSSLC